MVDTERGIGGMGLGGDVARGKPPELVRSGVSDARGRSAAAAAAASSSAEGLWSRASSTGEGGGLVDMGERHLSSDYQEEWWNYVAHVLQRGTQYIYNSQDVGIPYMQGSGDQAPGG